MSSVGESSSDLLESCHGRRPAGAETRSIAARIMAELMTRIFIYDTTLRDGSQGEGVNFSLQDKLLITARLDDAGIRLYRGGLSAFQPQGCRVFPRGPRPGI